MSTSFSNININMIYYPVVFVKKMMYLTLPHEFFPEN